MNEASRMKVDRALRSWVDTRFAQATRSAESGNAQQGNRSAVTGGQHLNGVDLLVREELAAASATGLIFKTGRPTLPGYYRATKAWDLVVFQGPEPILAIEYKSMKGSEGKNLNNRADEVFGVAEDLRQAEKHGLLPATMRRAYVFVMGVTEESLAPKKLPGVLAGKPDEAFEGASYLHRAAIMCERMRETGLYHLTWAVGVQEKPFEWQEPMPSVGWDVFAKGLRDMFDDGVVKPLPREEI
ncbi:PaeR7I family type II restriction endonuclease [Streptomyces sp. NPDC003035]|uniref:PaeR7I family type II restriction endonuclease n=1 Tax=Streptomyces sp. NPDC003035 TaxID=3364676 RepID=UPI0036B1F718